MSDERWFAARLADLDVEECWEQLASREVGRLAFTDEEGLAVAPVTYVLDDRAVVFRVAPYSSIGRFAPGREAAFEVDEVDDVTRSGWSVLLRGTVRVVHPDEIPDLAEEPVPWAAGMRALYLRLEPERVSGRRLVPS